MGTADLDLGILSTNDIAGSRFELEVASAQTSNMLGKNGISACLFG